MSNSFGFGRAFGFGSALQALLSGDYVKRHAWNRYDYAPEFLFVVDQSPYQAMPAKMSPYFAQGAKMRFEKQIFGLYVERYGDMIAKPYSASMSDQIATDWLYCQPAKDL